LVAWSPALESLAHKEWKFFAGITLLLQGDQSWCCVSIAVWGCVRIGVGRGRDKVCAKARKSWEGSWKVVDEIQQVM
jgi:hypothetical protein